MSFKKGYIPWNKGKKLTPEQKKSINLTGLSLGRGLLKGKNNPLFQKEKNFNWKGGVMQDSKYRNWLKNRWHQRRKEAIGSHSFEKWENLKAQYNWKCPSCQKREPEIKLTIDHIIPLSKGGSNNIENLQPLCKSCNCKKNAKTIKYEKNITN